MNCLLPIFSCFPFCKKKPFQKINLDNSGTNIQKNTQETQTELNSHTPMDIACTTPIKNDIRQIITIFEATIDSTFETTNNKLTSVEKKYDKLQDGIRTLFKIQNQRMQSLDQHQGNIPGDNTLDLTFGLSINSSAITDQSNSNEGSPSQSPSKIARPYGGLFLPAIQPSICFRPAGTANDHSLLSASTQTNVDEVKPPPKVTHEDLHQLNTKLDTVFNQLDKTQSNASNSIDKNTSNIQFVKKLVLETYKRNQKYLHNIEHNLLDQSNDIKDIKQSFNDLNLILNSLSTKLDKANQTANDHYKLSLGNMT